MCGPEFFEHPFYEEKMAGSCCADSRWDGRSRYMIATARYRDEFLHGKYLLLYWDSRIGSLLLALAVVSWLTRGIVRPLKAMQETAGSYGQR